MTIRPLAVRVRRGGIVILKPAPLPPAEVKDLLLLSRNSAEREHFAIRESDPKEA